MVCTCFCLVKWDKIVNWAYLSESTIILSKIWLLFWSRSSWPYLMLYPQPKIAHNFSMLYNYQFTTTSLGYLYFNWYEIFLHSSITFIPFDRQRGKESKPKYGLSRTLKWSTTQFLNGTSSSFYFMMRSCCIIRVHFFVILIAQKPLRIWYSYFL